MPSGVPVSACLVEHLFQHGERSTCFSVTSGVPVSACLVEYLFQHGERRVDLRHAREQLLQD